MEIRTLLKRLEQFDLEAIVETEGPTFIQTHKMIRPLQDTFYPACLYVGYVSELADEIADGGPANVICIDDAPIPPKFPQSGAVNLYRAPAGTNQYAVLNTIADIMIDEAGIVAGMRRLIDALYSGQGLQAIVDVASEIIGNPVFVNDSSFKILAVSQQSAFANSELERNRASGIVNEPSLADMRRDGVLGTHHHIPAQKVLRIKRSGSNEEWMFCDVRLHGVSIASIAVVDNDRPFHEGFDEELIARLSKVVALEIEKNEFFKDDASVMYEYLIGDLLSGKLQNDATIARRCHVIGWETARWFKVLVVANPTNAIPRESHVYLIGTLQGIISDCRWSVRQGNIVLVVSRPKKDVLYPREIEALETFLVQNGMACGVSEPFERLADAKLHYQQAYRALETGSIVSGGKKFVFDYAQMMPYYVAQEVLKRNDAEAFRPESVRTLQSYDEENGTELVSTLEAYLAFVEDTATAARELHVHRNTLLYRVARIKELTGIDFHDGDERFRIQLYFKLREYQRATWTRPS